MDGYKLSSFIDYLSAHFKISRPFKAAFADSPVEVLTVEDGPLLHLRTASFHHHGPFIFATDSTLIIFRIHFELKL